MKQRLAWLALGVGAYCAFWIATFPASAALGWFAPAQLAISNPSGTIWAGGATVTRVAGLTLTDIRWRLDAWSLLALRIAGSAEARLQDGFINFEFSLRPDRADLGDLQLSTSLENLREILPVYDTTAQVSASFNRITLEDGWPVAVDGEVRLGNLEVPSIGPSGSAGTVRLGSYRARFVDTGQRGAFADIGDLDGPVELTGRLALRPDRSYQLEARLRARPAAPAALVQGIEIMTSEPDADGLRSITFEGSL